MQYLTAYHALNHCPNSQILDALVSASSPEVQLGMPLCNFYEGLEAGQSHVGAAERLKIEMQHGRIWVG
jgi:hypothetical protein